MSRVQPQHPAGGDLETVGDEDLRADVRVQSEQLEARIGEHAAYRVERVAAGDREAELLVLVRCRDVFVRMRLDAGGHPDHDRCGDAELGGQRRASRSISSIESMMMRPTPTSSARRSSATDLLLPCSPMRRGRELGLDRDGELATGAHVEVEALLGDPARRGDAEECLAGVVDVGVGERLLEAARAASEVVLVEDVCRRAELGGEVESPTPLQRSAHRRPWRHVGRPEVRDELVGVLGRTQPARSAIAGLAVQCTCFVRPHLHPLRGADAEQAEAVGDDLPRRGDEHQPGAVEIGRLLVALRAARARRRRTCGTPRQCPRGSAPRDAAHAARRRGRRPADSRRARAAARPPARRRAATGRRSTRRSRRRGRPHCG